MTPQGPHPPAHQQQPPDPLLSPALRYESFSALAAHVSPSHPMVLLVPIAAAPQPHALFRPSSTTVLSPTLHSSTACCSASKLVKSVLTGASRLKTKSVKPDLLLFAHFYREREVLLLLRALRDEIDCLPLGLSLRQLNWNQQQQQRARDAGISLVASHASRDILKSPSTPLVLLQVFARSAVVAATAPASSPSHTRASDFEYLVVHPSASSCFPWACTPCLLQFVRCISLVHQPPGALAAAVACTEQGTQFVIQGSYRGGFTIRRDGVCLKGEGEAAIHGDGNKNTICISATGCLITGLVIAHAQHHALHITGTHCCVNRCKISDALHAAVGVFGSGGVALQGCWLGQRCASGVYTTDRSRASLSNCAVSLCTGAGLHCSGSSSITADGTCVVLTRKAGVFCEKSSCARLNDCTMLRNAFGGAHVVDAACITMLQCRQVPPALKPIGSFTRLRRLAHSRRGGVWCSGRGARADLFGCRIAFNRMSCVSACNGAAAHAAECSFQHEHRSAVFCDAASTARAVSPPADGHRCCAALLAL